MRTIHFALAAACACVMASHPCHAMSVAAPTEQESRNNADSLIIMRKSMERTPAEVVRTFQQAVDKQKTALQTLRGVNFARVSAPPPADPMGSRPMIMIGLMLGSLLSVGGILTVCTRRALSMKKAEQLAMIRPRAAASTAGMPVPKHVTQEVPRKPRPSTSLQNFLEARRSQTMQAVEAAPAASAEQASRGLARKAVGANKSEFVPIASLRLEALVPPKPAVPLKLDRPPTVQIKLGALKDHGSK